MVASIIRNEDRIMTFPLIAKCQALSNILEASNDISIQYHKFISGIFRKRNIYSDIFLTNIDLIDLDKTESIEENIIQQVMTCIKQNHNSGTANYFDSNFLFQDRKANFQDYSLETVSLSKHNDIFLIANSEEYNRIEHSTRNGTTIIYKESFVVNIISIL